MCECTGLIKPDITFFGEALPKEFFTAPELMAKADLVFIIGTSLKVFPFAFLAQVIPKNIPLVLINNEDCMPNDKGKLWLGGDIQENIKKIIADTKWEIVWFI